MNKRKLWINICKMVLFIGLLCVMLHTIFTVFNYKDMGGGAGWQRLYQAKKNSIDVMFFGSSLAHCTVDHKLLWDDYGIAGYTLSSGSQNIDSTYYFIKESLPVQKPEVIVIEACSVIGDGMNTSEVAAYRATLGVKWSVEYMECLNYFADELNMDEMQKQELFLKFPVIHSRYKELTKDDFEDSLPFMRGYRGSFEIMSFEKPVVIENDTEELDSHRQDMLQNIIDLSKEKNIPLLIFASPFVISDKQQRMYNKIAEIAAENQVPFINFNHLYDEIGLDFEHDFRDKSHLNNYGAAKVTDYLASYLKENYDISDRREETGYELWDQNSLYLRNKELSHELRTAEDINSYLQKMSEMEDEQLAILALTGNYTALGDVYLENLKLLGITDEEYQNGGIWIWKDGNRLLYLSGKEYNECIALKNGEIHIDSSLIENEDGDVVDEAHFLIDGNDYKMVENGINIIIYNESIDQLIDAAGDDIYLGLSVTHYEIPNE